MAHVTPQRLAEYPPIEPNYLEHMRQKGLSLVECDGCRSALLPVKNTRTQNYCEECGPKKALINRYTNKGNTLGPAERRRVFTDGKTRRVGPFFNPNKGK